MSAMPCDFEGGVDTIVAKPVPFAIVYVTLTKQEHIELVTQANYWKSCHHRATLGSRWAELEQRRALDQAALREAALRGELELAQAKIRDLQQRVFGRKSERSKGANESQPSVSGRSRGHQRGKPGHGRKMHPHLPVHVEVVELVGATCPKCGLGLSEFPGTEDAEVVELEVRAYRRVIRRRRYRPTCGCGCLPGIVTASAPARLIERGSVRGVGMDQRAVGQVSLRPPQPSAAAGSGRSRVEHGAGHAGRGLEDTCAVVLSPGAGVCAKAAQRLALARR